MTRVEFGDFAYGSAKEPMQFLLPDVASYVTDYSVPPEQMLGQATRLAHESRRRRPDGSATGSGA